MQQFFCWLGCQTSIEVLFKVGNEVCAKLRSTVSTVGDDLGIKAYDADLLRE